MQNKLLIWFIRKFREKQKTHIKQLSTFLQRISVLLAEGYTFAEAVEMLLPHHIASVEEKQQEIQECLRNGEGVLGVMRVIDLPEQLLISVAIAEHNGHLQQALAGMAKQLQFVDRMKQSIKKLMLYPVALLVFLLILFVTFRTYFFPNMERMFQARGASNTENSLLLSKTLMYIPEYGIVTGIFLGALFWLWRRLLNGQSLSVQIQWQLKVPFWNSYFRLIQTSAFAKYLGSLLLSGFSLQSALEILQKQTYQPILHYCAAQIWLKVLQGESLASAVQALNIFQRDFVVFVEHGEKSGFLGKELLLYSELLDAKFEDKMQRLVKMIQPAIFVVIACCILAAYLSLLLPMYSMIDII